VHVIGADPGKMTGLARVYRGVLTTCAVPALNVARTVTPWLLEEPGTIIGCERFVVTVRTAKLSAQPDAMGVTGTLESMADSDPRTRLIKQNMSDAKRLGNAKLRRQLGWQQTGLHAVHRNDAVCQVVKALHDCYPEVFQALVSPYVV
jgi:hypothetical protein